MMNDVCVFLDTCFLITLLGKDRERHETAERFFKYWVENAVPTYVPAIVYAEFQAVEDLPEEVLRRAPVVAFTAETAVVAGALARQRLANPGETGEKRDALKDDLKIIATACDYAMDYERVVIATEDQNSMGRFIADAAASTAIAKKLCPVILQDGFDADKALGVPPSPLFG